MTNLDLGWLGLAHYTSLPGWSMRLGVDDCQGSTVGSCGECAISGILPAADGRNQRCSNDTSIACADDAPCASGGGHCAIYAAPAMTIDIDTVTSCLLPEIVPPVTGTVAVESGDLALTLPVRATLYYVPCPVCSGDAVENDGIAGGTWQGGTRVNLPCDANATSPVPGFGSTSLDCPLEDEDEIGALAIPAQPLSFGTGTQTKTLSAASPFCTGDASRRCHCDTCNNAAATPCSTDADCVAVGATMCSGKRCLGGSHGGLFLQDEDARRRRHHASAVDRRSRRQGEDRGAREGRGAARRPAPEPGVAPDAANPFIERRRLLRVDVQLPARGEEHRGAVQGQGRLNEVSWARGTNSPSLRWAVSWP